MPELLAADHEEAPAGPADTQLELLYTELKACLERQLKEFDGLDQKAGILLAANGVLIGLVVQSGSKLGSGLTGALLLGTSMGLLLLGWLFGAIALLPRRLMTAPVPSGLWPGYWLKERKETLGDLCATVAYVYELNAGRAGRKLRFFRLQLVAVLAALSLLSAAYVLSLGGILLASMTKEQPTPAPQQTQHTPQPAQQPAQPAHQPAQPSPPGPKTELMGPLFREHRPPGITITSAGGSVEQQ